MEKQQNEQITLSQERESGDASMRESNKSSGQGKKRGRTIESDSSESRISGEDFGCTKKRTKSELKPYKSMQLRDRKAKCEALNPAGNTYRPKESVNNDSTKKREVGGAIYSILRSNAPRDKNANYQTVNAAINSCKVLNENYNSHAGKPTKTN